MLVKTVKAAEVPTKLEGMQVETIAGEVVSSLSYNAVVSKVKAAGRPLKMTFSRHHPAEQAEVCTSLPVYLSVCLSVSLVMMK